MAESKDKMVEVQNAKGHKATGGGKTNESMLKNGSSRAKLVNQFGSVKIGSRGK